MLQQWIDRLWGPLIGLTVGLLLLMGLTGCGSVTTGQETREHLIVDSLGREVSIPQEIQRVVVFNAYNAELMNALNVLDRAVGVDDFIYRDQAGFGQRFKSDQNVGKGGSGLNYEKIIALHPQVVIIGGTEESAEGMTKKLAPFGIKVVVVNSYYTEQFEQTCDIMGNIFGKEKAAHELKHYFLTKLEYIRQQLKDVPKRKVYFEYRKKGQTTIPGDYFYWMVEYAGVDNIFRDSRARIVDPEQIIQKDPAYIIKISDPISRSSYLPPTEEQMAQIKRELVERPGWDEIEAVQRDQILLMSHYVHGGASKLVGTMYIAKFVYPEYLPDLDPEKVFKEWLTKYQHLPYIEGHTSTVLGNGGR